MNERRTTESTHIICGGIVVNMSNEPDSDENYESKNTEHVNSRSEMKNNGCVMVSEVVSDIKKMEDTPTDTHKESDTKDTEPEYDPYSFCTVDGCDIYSFGEQYCAHHSKCSVCAENTEDGNIYCSDHKCSECHRMIDENCLFCEVCKCIMIDCKNKRLGVSSDTFAFCKRHTCRYGACVNGVVIIDKTRKTLGGVGGVGGAGGAGAGTNTRVQTGLLCEEHHDTNDEKDEETYSDSKGSDEIMSSGAGAGAGAGSGAGAGTNVHTRESRDTSGEEARRVFAIMAERERHRHMQQRERHRQQERDCGSPPNGMVEHIVSTLVQQALENGDEVDIDEVRIKAIRQAREIHMSCTSREHRHSRAGRDVPYCELGNCMEQCFVSGENIYPYCGDHLCMRGTCRNPVYSFVDDAGNITIICCNRCEEHDI